MKITVPINKIIGDVDILLTKAMKITKVEPVYNEEDQTSTYDFGKVKFGMFTFPEFMLLMQNEYIQITEIDFFVEVGKEVLNAQCLPHWKYASSTHVINEETGETEVYVRTIRENFQVFGEGKNKAIIRLVPAANENVNKSDFPDKPLFLAMYTVVGATNVLTGKEIGELLKTDEYAGDTIL